MLNGSPLLRALRRISLRRWPSGLRRLGLRRLDGDRCGGVVPEGDRRGETGGDMLASKYECWVKIREVKGNVRRREEIGSLKENIGETLEEEDYCG